MKKLSIILLLTGFFLFFSMNNASADFWASGVSETSGWYDAEKDNPNFEDDDLCWAASASNILAWSGWDAGYTAKAGDGLEDSIFDFLEAETPLDKGGWQSYAWNFWFDGTQNPGGLGHFVGSEHTGYYSTAEYNAALVQEWDDSDLDVAMDLAAGWLQDDYGVGLAVKANCYHAVTLWGIDTDEAGEYVGVWITDSDNSAAGADPRPNTLNYYDVFFGTDDLWHVWRCGYYRNGCPEDGRHPTRARACYHAPSGIRSLGPWCI